ncbi:general secretion pathway protein J [Pararobbsia alpina]|uniref:PulJ/GspJ family protein n=1 Tax=Pararobbsia alpina TaxID=621374 RepID=UPI0039A4302A
MKRVRTRSSAAGFTLIEMLVAIALLAVIAVMAWRGLDATIRGRDTVVSQLTQTRMLGRYFSQLQFDMLNLAAPEEMFGPPLRIQSNELVLVRHIGVGDGATRLQVVRYFLKGHQLLRSASQPLDTIDAVSGALKSMDRFASVIASNDVRGMRLSVWIAAQGWTSDQSVVIASYSKYLAQRGITTASAVGMPLPRGVRFSIQTDRGGEYMRTIPLAE